MTDKTDKKVWFITGAGRGMGVDFVNAALAAGHAVVATGRDTDAVAKAVGESSDLLVVKLDVTNRDDVEAATRAAVDRFGRIDVLVNNAGNFFAGYFEELTPEQIERQLGTLLIGAMNVTRAVLPVMRKQRSGHIISISSTAGIVGFAFCSAYAASKFGLEGWMESLQHEVAPFGITTTIVNPGFFRTELLEPASVTYAEPSIEDYADRNAEQLKWWKVQSGQQPGDPAKLALALVAIASEEPPPRRFIAGADAIALAEQTVADLQAQIDAHRDLSTSLAFDELEPAGSARWIAVQGPGTPNVLSEGRVAEQSSEGFHDGDQEEWLAAFRQRAAGAFYGRGTYRPPVPGTRSGARARRECHIRARRSDGMAHPSARSDPDRDFRLRAGAELGRPDREDSAG